MAQANSQPQNDSNGSFYQHRNESVFVPNGYFAIGRITAPHSLSGEIRVELHTDFPERFFEGLSVFVGPELTEMIIVAARPHKRMLLIKFAGIDNRTKADTLRGRWIFVPETEAVTLDDEDTYWVHEIIGMQVQTDEAEVLGVVSDVLFTGANDVYIIHGTDAEGNERELLLPAIADVIQKVDREEQLLTVHLLPGLLPE